MIKKFINTSISVTLDLETGVKFTCGGESWKGCPLCVCVWWYKDSPVKLEVKGEL